MELSGKTISLSKIKPNPENPRVIHDDKFRKLCESLKAFPQMMEKRPIVVDENWVILGGSGSTLIACEQLNRKCYMMELDPHYCDVILARWEKLTGRTAEKVN